MSTSTTVTMSSSTTTAPFKLSIGSKRAAPTTNGTTKSSAAFGDDVDVDGDAEQAQHISTFDASTSAKKVKPPRVIRGIPNKDWREESRRKRQKSGIPREAQVREGEEEQDVVTDEKPAYGLTVASRTSPQEATNEAAAANVKNDNSTAERQKSPSKPKTEDEEAMDALLGNRSATQRTIIAPPSPENEDDVFRSDFRTAPPPTTAEQYEATPVEGFGAALLRGYLKPGETLEDRIEGHANGLKASGKSKESVMKKRAGLLGIGAKESGLGVELGAWGKGSRSTKGQGQTEPGYNPLVRKNRNTGEVITEDALKEKLELQKEAALAANSNKSDGRHRRQIDDGDRKHDRRERTDNREEKNHRRHDRHENSRHDRSSSPDRRHRRSKHYEADDYEDHRERRERERHRRERDSDDRHDSRRSSRRDEDRRERHSERRDRDRDRRR